MTVTVYLTLAVGVVLLGALVLTTLSHLRRFTRAKAAAAADVARRTTTLRALLNSRRPGTE